MAALLKIVFVLHHQQLIEILMLLNMYLVVVRLPEFVMMMVVVVVDDHEYIPEYVSDKLTMIHDSKVPNQQQTYRYNVEFL
jgi:hypothetical protein